MKKDKLFVPCIICTYLMVLAISFIAKTDPWIWYDEAAQVWIGKGLNLDSPPLSPEGGIKDVIANNHDYNLDPGGFGLISYFWEKVSMHYLWLRALPFLFFVLTMICSAYLAFKWTKDRAFSLLMALAPATVPLLLDEAFEIRAYSMEVLGVYVALIALYNLSEGITLKKLALWSCAISVFLTSRYAFIPTAFVASLYVLYLIYREEIPLKKKLIYAGIYALPLFFTLFAIYMMAMRVQNPRCESLDYLAYLKTAPSQLIKIKSASYLLFVGLFIWISCVLPDKKLIRKHRPALYMLVSCTVLGIILSFLGLQPWIMTNYMLRSGSRWCISLPTLMLIAGSAAACEIYTVISRKLDIRYVLLVLICFQIVNNNAHDLKTFRHRDNPLTEYQSLMPVAGRIYMDRAESPAMRYQFEYGALKDSRADYPADITFLTCGKHCRSEESAAELDFEEWYELQPGFKDLYEEGYDVLVIPELKNRRDDLDERWQAVGEAGVYVRNEE